MLELQPLKQAKARLQREIADLLIDKARIVRELAELADHTTAQTVVETTNAALRGRRSASAQEQLLAMRTVISAKAQEVAETTDLARDAAKTHVLAKRRSEATQRVLAATKQDLNQTKDEIAEVKGEYATWRERTAEELLSAFRTMKHQAVDATLAARDLIRTAQARFADIEDEKAKVADDRRIVDRLKTELTKRVKIAQEAATFWRRTAGEALLIKEQGRAAAQSLQAALDEQLAVLEAAKRNQEYTDADRHALQKLLADYQAAITVEKQSLEGARQAYTTKSQLLETKEQWLADREKTLSRAFNEARRKNLL